MADGEIRVDATLTIDQAQKKLKTFERDVNKFGNAWQNATIRVKQLEETQRRLASEGGRYSSEMRKALKDVASFSDATAKEISSRLTAAFNISDTKSVRAIEKAVKSYQEAFDAGDASGIQTSLDNVFDVIEGALSKFSGKTDEAEEVYRDFLNYINSSQIDVPKFGDDWNNEIKKVFRPGVVTAKGLPIDKVFQEISEQWPHLFSEATTNIEDQTLRIVEVIKDARSAIKDTELSDTEVRNVFGYDGWREVEGIIGDTIDSVRLDLSRLQDVQDTEITVDSKVDTKALISVNRRLIEARANADVLRQEFENAKESAETMSLAVRSMELARNARAATEWAESNERYRADMEQFANDENARQSALTETTRLLNEQAQTAEAVKRSYSDISKSATEIAEEQSKATLEPYFLQLDLAKDALNYISDMLKDMEMSGEPPRGIVGWRKSIEISRAELEKFAAELTSLETKGTLEISSTKSLSPDTIAGLEAVSQSIQRVSDKVESVGVKAGIAAAEFDALPATMDKASDAADRQRSILQQVAGVSASVGSSIRKAFSGATSIVGKFGKSLKGIRRDTKTVSDGFTRLGKRLIGLAVTALVFNQIRRELRRLVAYYGDAMKQNTQLYASFALLKGSALTAFQPLYEVAIPIIITFVNWLATAIQHLATFTAMLFQLDPKQMQTNAKAVWDNVKGLKAGAAAAKKFLAPFDELTVIAEDAAGADMSEVVPDFDWEPPPIADWLTDLKEKLFDIAPDLEYFYDLGKTLAQKIIDGLSNIPWNDIKAWAASLSRKLAAFLNGFLANPALWAEFGRTIAEALNTALTFAYNFLTTFDWRGFGGALAAGINTFFDTFDWALFGQTVSAWALGLLTLILSVIQNVDWTKVGDSLGTFLSNIDWEEIADTVLRVAASTFGAVRDLLMGLFDIGEEWEMNFDALLAIVTGFVTALVMGFSPIGIITGIVAGLTTAVLLLGESLGWFEKVVPEIKRYSGDISDATKNMLDPVIDNADKARDKLKAVFEEGKPIVAKDALEIAGYFKGMADEAIYQLERQKDAAVKWAAEAFGKEAADYEKRLAVVNKTYDAMIEDIERHAAKLDEAALQAAATFGRESKEYKTAQAEYEAYASSIGYETAKINAARDEELAKTLENFGEQAAAWEEQKQTISDNYDEQIGIIRSKNDEQYAIISSSLADGEALTKESYNTLLGTVEQGLSDIQGVMVTDAAERLSLEKQRNEDLINEQKHHVSDVLQEAATERDEAIKAAKEKHDGIDRENRRLLTSGKITRDEYAKMSADAWDNRNAEINAAKEKYDGILKEATKGMDNIDKELNTKTGKIKTNWDNWLDNLRLEFKSFLDYLFTKPAQRSLASGGTAVSSSTYRFSPQVLPEIQIPKLARGGIVDSATLAMIGEKGREAVVPLSRNAEWMEPMNRVREELEINNSLMRQFMEMVAGKEFAAYLDGKAIADNTYSRLFSDIRSGRKGALPT